MNTATPALAGPTVALQTSARRRRWQKFVRHPLGVIGGIILLVVFGSALFADYLAPHEPNKQRLVARFKPPVWAPGGNAQYPLGTDNVGRDILSRIIHGSRISLVVGFAAVGISMLIGVTLGLLSGFLGGRVDATIMGLADLMLAFPQLILVFAMVAVLGPGIDNINVAWWLSTFPVLAINLIGDRARDLLDPRVT